MQNYRNLKMQNSVNDKRDSGLLNNFIDLEHKKVVNKLVENSNARDK